MKTEKLLELEENSKRVLRHYFKQAIEKSGGKWDSDFDVEIGDIIGNIFDVLESHDNSITNLYDGLNLLRADIPNDLEEPLSRVENMAGRAKSATDEHDYKIRDLENNVYHLQDQVRNLESRLDRISRY